MLTTLGLGDMTPVDPLIRAVSPLEALTGFGLLTTALAWFSQIYPPMSRRRALALQVDGLAEADCAAAVPDVDAASLSRTLDSLALEIARVRVDFAQHAEGQLGREVNPRAVSPRAWGEKTDLFLRHLYDRPLVSIPLDESNA